MIDARAEFAPLPGSGRRGPRRCGVEIEFSGLTETETAACIVEALGGEAAPDGAHELTVTGTAIGTIRVELDTVLRKMDLPGREMGLDLMRSVVPIEIVTDPLDVAGLAELQRLVDALRHRGAQGTTEGIFLGFGLHLNPETPLGDAATIRIVQAYAVLEEWLRARNPIDATRRFLPFVAPWPLSLCDAVLCYRGSDPGALMRLYAEHSTSRNHGLDLLPLFADHDPDLFAATFPQAGSVAARPTFHFRLPDCRIDDPDWSLHVPWNEWRLVEDLADTPVLDRLIADWAEFRSGTARHPGDWVAHVETVRKGVAA